MQRCPATYAVAALTSGFGLRFTEPHSSETPPYCFPTGIPPGHICPLGVSDCVGVSTLGYGASCTASPPGGRWLQTKRIYPDITRRPGDLDSGQGRGRPRRRHVPAHVV